MDSTALELVEKALRLIAEATQEHPVILYCKTGPRSRRAWELLSQLYAGKIDGKIQVLQGGHMEWLTGL
jgi:rhodanese-related sulfurtransferase